MAVLENTEIENVDLLEDGLTSRVAEMGPLDTLTIDVPVDSVKIQKIKERDADPMFVVVEVESGWSISKNKWSEEIVRKAVKRANEIKPVGHLGHPLLKSDKAYETEFPDPQVVWLGGTHTKRGDKTVAYFKGYILPGSRARVLLENDAIDGVSWFGPTTRRPVKGGYEVIDFELENIDFARKGRSGMKSRIAGITGEEAPRGGNTVEAKDIAALDESELRTHAPLLVKEIERKATEPVEEKIGEMETAATAAAPELDLMTKIRELLKLSDGENPIEKLQTLMETLEESASSGIKDFIKSLVAKKVKDERGQSIVNRFIGEMHTEYKGQELTDDLKVEIEKDFEAKVEGDEDIKAVIGEMTTETRTPRRGEGGTGLGGRSAPSDERTRDDGKGKRTENDNMVRTTRKLA